MLSTLLIELMILLWLLALGGAIGSFLNVVAYRLPLGISLVEPRSHCPQCKHPIRWHDNIPVLGWLMLKGHCRDCGLPIAGRYAIVEAIAAGLFVLMGVAECLTWGANLPSRPMAVADGFIAPPLGVGELTGILLYHLLLLSTVLAAALLEYDGQRVSWRVSLPALIVGFAAPLIWPHLHPVPVSRGLEGWVAGLVDGLAGAAAGTAWGLVVEYELDEIRDFGRAAVWTCAGLVLGWQAAIAVGIGTTAVYLLVLSLRLVFPGDKKPGWLAALGLTTVFWLLVWSPVANRWPILK